jgi:subtilase family serine protease
VEAASDSEDDLVAGILFAVHHNLGNVISNSYGGPESQQGLPSYDPFDPVLLLAAAHGIAVNFSSGDDGDYYAVEGYTDVTYPASSPFATGVGGTSLFLNSNQTMNFQTGWGSNGTVIAAPPVSPYSSVPIVPPDVVGFIYGSGGGTSAVFSKPSWQRSLPGSHRMVPDISFTADPYTGLEVICTGASCFNSDPVDLYLGVIGGTSLACPMFSALWAVANEQSGRPLGQAAPLLYSLPSGAITDVVPVGSAADVTGVITNDHVITHYSALQLIQPETSAAFVSAIWDANSVGAPGPWIILSFGTDSSLFTTHGWDDVTGLGTPNGLNFVNAVAPPRH